MDASGLPAQIIESSWQYATRELDHPNSCRLAMIFSAGSPAWPVEYALKLLASEGQALLTTDDAARILGRVPLPPAVNGLLTFYLRLRAAMFRIPHYPNPVLPETWPETPGVRLLGCGGTSALATAMRVLGEIEGGIGGGSGQVLRLDPGIGQPQPAEPGASMDSTEYETWYRRGMDELRRLVLRTCFSVDALEPEVSALLPVLQDEHRRWREKEQEGNRRSIGQHGMSWQKAKKLAEAYVKARKGVYPGFNVLANKIGCGKGTMEKAIQNSTYLTARRAEHNARKRRPREVPLSDARLEQTPASGETVDSLAAEQEADRRREERQYRAARRQGKV